MNFDLSHKTCKISDLINSCGVWHLGLAKLLEHGNINFLARAIRFVAMILQVRQIVPKTFAEGESKFGNSSEIYALLTES